MLSASSGLSATPLLDDTTTPPTPNTHGQTPQSGASSKRKRDHVDTEGYSNAISPSRYTFPLEQGFGSFHVNESLLSPALPYQPDFLRFADGLHSGVTPPESFQRSTSQLAPSISAQAPQGHQGTNVQIFPYHQGCSLVSSEPPPWPSNGQAARHEQDTHEGDPSNVNMWFGTKDTYEWNDFPSLDTELASIPSVEENENSGVSFAHSAFDNSQGFHGQGGISTRDQSASATHNWQNNTIDNTAFQNLPNFAKVSAQKSQFPEASSHPLNLSSGLSMPLTNAFAHCDGSLPCAEVSPHCELPCDQECTDEGCESCDESQLCCEPCPDPERCSSEVCDDAACLEDPKSSACVGKVASVCCSSRSSIAPEDRNFVDPKVLELPCHWQRGDGSVCDVLMHSREELSNHVHEQHIQPQSYVPCQWDQCLDTIPLGDFQDHVFQTHLSQANGGMDACLWDGCGISFDSLKHFGQHFSAQPSTSQFSCRWDGCEKAVGGEQALKEHVDTHHITEPSAPKDDSRDSTADIEVLETSLDSLSADDKEANKVYISNVLNMCPRKPRPGNYKCEWMLSAGGACGHTFTDANDLQHHVDSIHMFDFRQNKGLDLICQWRGCTRQFKFNERSKLVRHLYTHTRFTMSTCCFCDHDFNNQTQLVNHVRGHLGHTHFACPKCNYVTTNKAALKTHERTHTQSKPLKCEICDYCCGDPSNMSKHRNTHREPKHKCPNCGKAFCRPGTMKRHLGTCGKSADEKARRKGGVQKQSVGKFVKVKAGA